MKRCLHVSPRLKRWLARLLWLTWATGLPLAASAAPAEATNCVKSRTEAELRRCRAAGLKKSEDALAQLLQQLKASAADPRVIKAIDSAQRSWPAFRDAECEILTQQSAGGSAYDIYLMDCRETMNLRRIAWLQPLVDNP